MIIYPAIDLKAGQCVRLYQGSFDQVTTYDLDPITIAQDYELAGAKFLHVVDLDGAKQGDAAQTEIVLNMAKNTRLKIQMGGGIRSKAYAEQLLANGIWRVVVGSLAIQNPRDVKTWIQAFGSEHVVLALDVCTQKVEVPMLKTHGWQEASTISLWQILDEYQNAGLKHVLCTDIDVDGTLQGPNFQLYQECQERYPELAFQASGGIGSLQDLEQLAKMSMSGVVIGKALYEQKFSLVDALKVGQA